MLRNLQGDRDGFFRCLRKMDMGSVRPGLLSKLIQIIIQVSDSMEPDLASPFPPRIPVAMLLRRELAETRRSVVNFTALRRKSLLRA